MFKARDCPRRLFSNRRALNKLFASLYALATDLSPCRSVLSLTRSLSSSFSADMLTEEELPLAEQPAGDEEMQHAVFPESQVSRLCVSSSWG